MDELDFGRGVAVLVVGLAFLAELIKGLIRLLLVYGPAQLVYRIFFKTESTKQNFFSAFFCWAISWNLLHNVAYRFVEWLSPEAVNQLCTAVDYNNLFHYHSFFIFFIFWKYHYDKTSNRFVIAKAFKWFYKFIRYVGLFCLLFFIGVFLFFGESSYVSYYTQSVVAMGLTLLYIALFNFKFSSKVNSL